MLAFLSFIAWISGIMYVLSLILAPLGLLAAKIRHSIMGRDHDDIHRDLQNAVARVKTEKSRIQEKKEALRKNDRQEEADELEADTREMEEQRDRILLELREFREKEKLGQNSFARLFVGNPTVGGISISQLSLWLMIVATSFVFHRLLTGLLQWLHNRDVTGELITGSVALILWAIVLRSSLKTIPNNPPHRGVLTVFDRRTQVEFNEGWVFLCPIIENIIAVNVVKRDYDVKILDVRAKDDAGLDVKVSVAYIPDPDRLRRFLQVGSQNIVSLLDSLVQQEVRIFLYERTQWEIAKRPVLGQSEREEYMREPYQTALALRKDLIDILINSLTGSRNGAADLDPNHGLSDIQGWGIKFLNIFIGPIHLTGKLVDAAEKRAIEAAERGAEMFQGVTDSGVATTLVEAAKNRGVELDYTVALRMVMDYRTANAGHGFSLPGISQAVTELLSKLRR